VAPSRNSLRRSSRKRPSSGRRSARPAERRASTASAPPRPAGGAPRSIKASRDEAPKPIWAPLPITEALILIGLVVAAVGLVRGEPPLVLGGLVLVMLSSLELAAREHFAGYRSHSSLLAGVGALVVGPGGGLLLHALDVADPPAWALIVVAAVVFAALFGVFRRAFRRRSGGLPFRV
jgi:hypothetical protein